jgi:hypothetical protein
MVEISRAKIDESYERLKRWIDGEIEAGLGAPELLTALAKGVAHAASCTIDPKVSAYMTKECVDIFVDSILENEPKMEVH